MEDIKLEDEKSSTEQELKVEDCVSGVNFIKNPAVGKETEDLEVEKINKNFNISAQDKEGNAFKTNLSGVDYKIDIHTNKGIYSPSSWEVWNKIQKIVRKNNSTKIKIKIKHLVDGSLAKERVDRVAKLNDVSEDKAQEMINESKQAKKDKQIYQVIDLSDGECY